MLLPAMFFLLGGGSNPPQSVTSTPREDLIAWEFPIEPERWLGAPLQRATGLVNPHETTWSRAASSPLRPHPSPTTA